MKQLIIALIVAIASLAIADEPFSWDFSTNGNQAVVTLIVAESCYIYSDSTTVELVPEAEELQSPQFVTAIDPTTETEESFFSTGEHQWIFAIENDVDYEANIRYMGCSSGSESEAALCFPPKRLTLSSEPQLERATPEISTSEKLPEFSVVFSATGLMSGAEMVKFLEQTPEPSPWEGKGFWGILFLVLLGGLALNLTPCVLPLIPINLAIIGAGQKAESRFSGLINGSIYALGMAITYGVLGLLAAFAGAKFGSLNSSSIFNFIIAVVFIYLALAMFGVFNLDFSRFGGQRKVNSSSWLGKLIVLLFGMMAALLAGACVAPVIVTVLLLAATGYAEGNSWAILWPFILGIGMALPWPLAGAGVGVIPKPGAWMQYVKWLFGVIISVMAIYYIYTGWMLLPSTSSAENYSTASEIAKLEQALVSAKASGKRVFIDVWSTTCKNCIYMEKTTFKEPEVEAELEGFVVVKYQIEDFEHPANQELLDRLSAIGLPAFGILESYDY